MALDDRKPSTNPSASASTGFAKAVAPVTAQAISTDAVGLITSDVRIPTRDGELPAFEAHPATGNAYPVVLVVHEIFGVHEHIRDICRRLAKLGYWAIAPELFARQGDVSKMADINEIMAQVVSRTPDDQIIADLDATLTWAENSGKADAAKTAITGFCWGGRMTWLYAAHNPRLKAAVAWYGRLEGNHTANQPRHPLDVVAALKIPVLGLYGEADHAVPLESIERMRAALKASRSGSDIVTYPNAPHAFFADYRPNYRKDAAEDGWRRLCQWFAAHGIA